MPARKNKKSAIPAPRTARWPIHILVISLAVGAGCVAIFFHLGRQNAALESALLEQANRSDQDRAAGAMMSRLEASYPNGAWVRLRYPAFDAYWYACEALREDGGKQKVSLGFKVFPDGETEVLKGGLGEQLREIEECLNRKLSMERSENGKWIDSRQETSLYNRPHASPGEGAPFESDAARARQRLDERD